MKRVQDRTASITKSTPDQDLSAEIEAECITFYLISMAIHNTTDRIVRMNQDLAAPSLLVGFTLWFLIGCDLPDRHDIASLRRPAVWEVDAHSSIIQDGNAGLARVNQNDRVTDSNVAAMNSLPPDTSQDWESWFVHRLEPETPGELSRTDQQNLVLGGVRMRSAGGQVNLVERELIRPNATRSSAGTRDSNEEEAEQNNHVLCLTANDQTFQHGEDGRLERVECTVRRGPVETRKTILVTPESVRIEHIEPSSQRTKTLRVSGPVGGPLIVYSSLRGNLLAPGESRESMVLLPIPEALATLRLVGKPIALAKRMTTDGVVFDSLNEAVCSISVDGSLARDRYYWYDEKGVVQATQISNEGRFTYRCEKQQFQALGKLFLSQSHPITVEIPGKLISLQTEKTLGKQAFVKQLAIDVRLRPAANRLSNTDSKISRPRIPTAPRQYTQSIGEGSINEGRQRVITADKPVTAKRLAGRFKSFESDPTPKDLVPTNIVDFQSAPVRKVLGTVSSLGGLAKLEQAEEMNRTIHSLLSVKYLSTGIRRAAEIVQSSTADSTEHAIVLIAMLRANEIPARMAIGLRFLETGESSQFGKSERRVNRFGYHAWVIAFVDDQWIAFDPTRGTRTGADCIALETIDLSELDPDQFVDHYLGLLRSMRLTVQAVVTGIR